MPDPIYIELDPYEPTKPKYEKKPKINIELDPYEPLPPTPNRPLEIGDPTIVPTPSHDKIKPPPTAGDIRKAYTEAYNYRAGLRAIQGSDQPPDKDLAKAAAPRTKEYGSPPTAHPVTKAPDSLWDALHSQPIETKAEYDARVEEWKFLRDARMVIQPGTDGDTERALEYQAAFPGLTPEQIVERVSSGKSPKELVTDYVHGVRKGVAVATVGGGGVVNTLVGGTVGGFGSLYNALTTPENGYIPLYESTFQTALRDFLLMERFIATPLRRALTYEVDPETREPLNKEDPAYKIEQKLGLDDVPAALTIGKIPTPRPFQGSTYPETEESLYDQIIYDLAKGEFVDYSILPEYADSVTPTGASIIGLATSFFIPVVPTFKLGTLTRKASDIRQLQVANATLKHYGLPMLEKGVTEPLLKAADALGDFAMKNYGKLPKQLQAQLGFRQSQVGGTLENAAARAEDIVTGAADSGLLKVEAKKWFYEYFKQHVPDADLIYVSKTHVASKHTWENAVDDIAETVQEMAKVQPPKTADDWDILQSIAAEIHAGAWVPTKKGKAFEHASKAKSSFKYGQEARRIFMSNVVDTVLRRKMVPDFGALKGNALTARILKHAQQEAAGVIHGITKELGFKSPNKLIQERIATRGRLLSDSMDISQRAGWNKAFAEWHDITLHQHFGKPIDETVRDEAIRRAILNHNGAFDELDYLGRFKAIATELEAMDKTLIGARGMLGFGPVNYMGASVAYLVHADTGAILHKAFDRLSWIAPDAHLPMHWNQFWGATKKKHMLYYRGVLSEVAQSMLQKRMPKISIPKSATQALERHYIRQKMDKAEYAPLMAQHVQSWQNTIYHWAHNTLFSHAGKSDDFIPQLSSFQNIPIPFILDKAERDVLIQLKDGVASGTLAKALQDLHVKDPHMAKWVGNSVMALGRFARSVAVSGLLGGINILMPGTRFMGTNLLTAPFIMHVTVGPKMAARATAGAVKELAFKHLPEWVSLGKFKPTLGRQDTIRFVSHNGIPYTEGMLAKLETQYNIRDTQVSHEFRTTMLDQILRDAKLTIEGQRSGIFRQAYRWLLQPDGRGAVGTIVHESDMLFRRQVFRAALADGKTPEAAADLARRSLLDYAGISKWETQNISRIVLFWTFRRQMLVATAKALLERPEQLKQLYVLTRALHTEEDALVNEQNQHLTRLYAYDAGDSTIITGPILPGLDALNQLGNIFDLASSISPSSPLEPLTQTIKLGQEIIFSPATEMLGGAMEFDPAFVRNKDLPKLPGRISLALSMVPKDQRDTLLQFYDLGPVTIDKAKQGTVRWGVEEDNPGYELEFKSLKGYYRYLASVYALQTTGLYTGGTNYLFMGARLGAKPDSVDLGYLGKGSTPLYMLGAQTPQRMPKYFERQAAAASKTLAELEEIADAE